MLRPSWTGYVSTHPRFVTCQGGDAHRSVPQRSARFEMFVTPERLNAWYMESGLLDAITPGTEDDVREATAVREAVYRLVTDRRLGEEFDREALAVVNAGARKTPVIPQLTLGGRHAEGTTGQALATVARHAVELLSGPDVPLMKECGNPECTRVHIDRSRGMRRQWCGMESCGNKIKAAAYRARKKTAPTASAH
ncbi:CGNR zinc finger domain-containing protein [Streptomyces davaonensis]